MKNILFLALIFQVMLLLASGCASVLEPDISVTFVGTVIMSDKGDPSGVNVRVSGQDGKSTTTVSGGSYSLAGKVVGSATITLVFSKDNYQTAQHTETVGEITVGSGEDAETKTISGEVKIDPITLNRI